MIFPFRVEEDNNRAFSFTLELAQKSNANIVALTSLNLSWKDQNDGDNLDNLAAERKDEIYCKLLEMIGYYHGGFNQWNAFNNVKVHVSICRNDINGAICSFIDDHEMSIIVIQQKYFSESGLCEEILSDPSLSKSSIYVLPSDHEFIEPSAHLIGPIFHNQKKFAFNKLLSEIKMFDLPEQYHDFKEYMMIQQAV